MKSLVILGGNGYIGECLIKKIHQKYKIKVLIHGDKNPFKGLKNVKVFFGNVLDRNCIDKIIGKGDKVINCVGTTTVTRDESDHFNINVTGQQIVASVCVQKEADVIYLSTINLYPGGSRAARETGETHSRDVYSLTKKLGEEIYQFYAKNHNLSAIILRLGSVYGPHHKKGVVYTMSQSLKNSGKIKIPKTEVARDFIYIDDVVDAIERSIQYRDGGYEVFNIAEGKKLTLEKLALAVISIAGGNHKIERTSQKAYPEVIYADVSKARKKLAFNAKTSLIAGLQEVIV